MRTQTCHDMTLIKHVPVYPYIKHLPNKWPLASTTDYASTLRHALRQCSTNSDLFQHITTSIAFTIIHYIVCVDVKVLLA